MLPESSLCIQKFCKNVFGEIWKFSVSTTMDFSFATISTIIKLKILWWMPIIIFRTSNFRVISKRLIQLDDCSKTPPKHDYDAFLLCYYSYHITNYLFYYIPTIIKAPLWFVNYQILGSPLTVITYLYFIYFHRQLFSWHPKYTEQCLKSHS